MIYINLTIIFLLIIFIHELGHYTIAKFYKIKVTDFSIGFGKVLYKFTDKSHTNWKLSLIPLGGYVKIKGLEKIFQNSNTIDLETDSFNSLKLFKKIFVLLGGSLFNIFSAWLVLFLFLFFSGIISFPPIVGNVLENSPASLNDIRIGDTILKINNNPIKNFSDIGKKINDSKFINIDIIRNNNILNKNIELQYNDKLKKFFLGISSTNNPTTNQYQFLNSLNQSFIFIPTYYSEMFKFLFISFKNETLSKELAGPIGMVKMADKLMLDKINGVIFIFIMISLFVAIFNLFPIPLLDGGHIIYFILRSIFSNRLPIFITRLYLTIGITIISFLFIIITFNDIFYK